MTIEQVLQDEFAGSFYDLMSDDDAFFVFTSGWTLKTIEQRPKPFTVSQVLALCSQASLAKLVMLPSLTDIRDKIEANDGDSLLLWCQFLAGAGTITTSEATAIAAACQATETAEVETEESPRIHTAFAGHAGFPNEITREHFDAAWAAAGRE